MLQEINVIGVWSVDLVENVDQIVEWVTVNLFQKSKIFSECLDCVSQLPLQKEHKLSLRKCLSTFSNDMTVEEKGISIHFLLRITSSKQEYSLCDFLCSLLFSLSFEQCAPIFPMLTKQVEMKKCVLSSVL